MLVKDTVRAAVFLRSCSAITAGAAGLSRTVYLSCFQVKIYMRPAVFGPPSHNTITWTRNAVIWSHVLSTHREMDVSRRSLSKFINIKSKINNSILLLFVYHFLYSFYVLFLFYDL